MSRKLDIPSKVIGDKFNASECNDIVDEINNLYDNQNIFNLDIEIPLSSGFYTQTTARLAIPDLIKKYGLTIIYKINSSTYIEDTYIGISITDTAWALESNWKKRTVSSIFYVNQFNTSKIFYRTIVNSVECVIIPLTIPTNGSITDFDSYIGEIRFWLYDIENDSTKSFSSDFDLSSNNDLPIIISWTSSDGSETRYAYLALTLGSQSYIKAKVKDLYGKNIAIQFNGAQHSNQLVINGTQDSIGVISSTIPLTINPYLLTNKNYNVTESTNSEIIVNATGTGSTITLPQNPGWTENKVIRVTVENGSKDISIINGSTTTTYSENSTVTLVYDYSSDSWTEVASVEDISISNTDDIVVDLALNNITESALTKNNDNIFLWNKSIDGNNLSAGQLVAILKSSNIDYIGVYEVLYIVHNPFLVNGGYSILKLVTSNINLRIIRVKYGISNKGFWQSEYNGVDTSTIIFERLADKANASLVELLANKTSAITDDNKNSATLYPNLLAITTILSTIYTKTEIDALLVSNKGYYATSAALIAAWPNGSAGYYALVGETNTVWVWDSSLSTPAWIDSDQKGQVSSIIYNNTSNIGEVTLSVATDSLDGLESKLDKTKLDALDETIASESDFETGTDNSKRTTVINIVNGLKYWLNNLSLTLSTSAQTIAGAINELFVDKANNGANSDITSLTGLTTPLSIPQGGTGSSIKNFVDLLTDQTKAGYLALSNGIIIYGTPSAFPTSIGYYLLQYVDNSNNIIITGYNGTQYQTLNIGPKVNSVFSLVLNSNGTINLNGAVSSVGIHNVGNLQQDFGSDATGDLLYRLASGLLGRLPIGSDDQILNATSGVPVWDSRVATNDRVGFVKPDNNTIKIDTGVISVPLISKTYSSDVYVDASNTNTGNGSIVNPFQTIQEAITYMIGTGTRMAPEYTGTINIGTGTYVVTSNDNLAINNVHYKLTTENSIINYTGYCLDKSGLAISAVNYSSLYIPSYTINLNICTTKTSLSSFISSDSLATNCKAGTLVHTPNGSLYLLMSSNYTLTSEWKPISGVFSYNGTYKGYTEFYGFVDGCGTSPIQIYCTSTTGTDNITLTGDGTTNLGTLISTWNSANSSYPLYVNPTYDGAGTMLSLTTINALIPASGVVITLFAVGSSSDQALFNYDGFTTNFIPSTITGLGTIKLLGTAGLYILPKNYRCTQQFSIIGIQVITNTSLLPLFLNKNVFSSSNTQQLILDNCIITNNNGTGIWYDLTVSNVILYMYPTCQINHGHESMVYRGISAFTILNTSMTYIKGSITLRFSNYLFTLGSFNIGYLPTNNLGVFISGFISGVSTDGKQSIGLVEGRSIFKSNEKAGVYVQNLLINKQLTVTSLNDSIFSPTLQNIFSFASNPINFIVQNCSFRNIPSDLAFSYMGENANSVGSVNRFGNSLYFNGIPISALPDDDYVLVVDSNGKTVKVKVSEIKTPTVVTTDTYYTEQTSISGFILNDTQVGSISNSNILGVKVISYSSYTGIPTGFTTSITLTANSIGVIGNSITLTGDGTSTLTTLISTWNSNNPTNELTLTTGDGTQILSSGSTITLSGGVDEYAPYLLVNTGYNMYTGIPTGFTTSITLTANSKNTTNITLTGDGTSTLTTLISTWNSNNPTNELTLTTGDGTQILSSGSTITLTCAYNSDNYKIDSQIIEWSAIKDKPEFSTIATTGSYSDLSGTPDLTLYCKISDYNSEIIVNLGVDTDILTLIRSYATTYATDTSTKKFKHILIRSNGYTSTIGTLTSTNNIRFDLDFYQDSSANILSTGLMMILDSSNLNPITYEISINATSYSIDKLLKSSDIVSSTSIMHELAINLASNQVNSNVTVLYGSTLTGTTLTARNWTTNNGTAIASGYIDIDIAIQWKADGGTTFNFNIIVEIGGVDVLVMTDRPLSSTGIALLSSFHYWGSITKGQTIRLLATTTANNSDIQTNSFVKFKITE